MSQYYYTITSLPFLSFSQKPVITLAAFKEVCKIELKEDDLGKVLLADFSRLPDKALPEKGQQFPFLRQWLCWEANLRNTLARLRAKKKGIQADKYLRPAEDQLEAASVGQAAFEEESPVKADELMDKARWRFLEELEMGHYFDVPKLMIYYLKLQILERRYGLQPDKGKERYNEMIGRFYNSIENQEQPYGK